MRNLLAALLFGAAAIAAPAPAPADSSTTSTLLPNSYVVVLNDEVEDANDFLSGLHLNIPEGPMFVYNDALKGFAAQLDDAGLALLRANPQVTMIEPDMIATADSEERLVPYGLAITSARIPYTPDQAKNYYYSHTGAGVIVYVLDSGINGQPDFGNRVFIGPTFVTERYGFAPEPNKDLNGHGTGVAGCVGGHLYGTAKQVLMASLKVLNSEGKGHNSGIIAAVDYAVRHCGSSKCVINMSLGGGVYPPLDNAVAGAVNKGVTVIAAAGNNNTNACTFSPAAAPQAITVGAISRDYSRAEFSNYGKCVDIFAAGVNVLTDSYQYPNQPDAIMQGTSFSAPYVAGLAAYFLTAGAQTPSDVRLYLNHYGRKNLVTDDQGSTNIVANNGYYFGLG